VDSVHSTDEHYLDIENRMDDDLAAVLRDHAIEPDTGCLLECLTDAAMRHVDDLLIKVDFDE
jgi:hypothetical protein